MARAQGHVDLPGDGIVVEIRRTHHCQNLSGFWLDGHQSAIGGIFLRQCRHLLLYRGLSHLLQLRVQCGVHAKAGTVNGLRVVFGFQQVTDVIDPVRIDHRVGLLLKGVTLRSHVSISSFLRRNANALRDGAHIDTILFFGHIVHGNEHLLVAIERGLAIGKNIIDTGGLRQPRQKSGLRKGQLTGRGVKVGLSGSLNAVSQVAIVELVEIQLQNLILGVAPRHFGREDDLARLAPH